MSPTVFGCRCAVVTMLLVGAACGGGSPTSPNSNSGLSGNWSGTLFFFTDGDTFNLCSEPATASITQNGSLIFGSFSDGGLCDGGWKSTFSGTVVGNKLSVTVVLTVGGETFDCEGKFEDGELRINLTGRPSWTLHR